MSELPKMTDLIASIRELEAREVTLRATTIEECAKAARDGFEAAMEDYVMIGPSGMAMRMINSIKALNADKQG